MNWNRFEIFLGEQIPRCVKTALDMSGYSLGGKNNLLIFNMCNNVFYSITMNEFAPSALFANICKENVHLQCYSAHFNDQYTYMVQIRTSLVNMVNELSHVYIYCITINIQFEIVVKV